MMSLDEAIMKQSCTYAQHVIRASFFLINADVLTITTTVGKIVQTCIIRTGTFESWINKA